MAVVEVAKEEEDNTNDAVMPFYAAIEDSVTPLHDHDSACVILLRYSAQIGSTDGRMPLRMQLQIGANRTALLILQNGVGRRGRGESQPKRGRKKEKKKEK